MKSPFKQLILLALLLVALVAVEAKLLPGPILPDPFRNVNLGKHIRHRNEAVFNVLSFGAKPDGKTDNTQVIIVKNVFVVVFNMFCC